MSPSPSDFPEQPTEIPTEHDGVELQTAVSLTPTEFRAAEIEETAITPRPSRERIKAPAPRRYLLALSTDGGPRMLAYADQRLSVGRLEDNALCLQHGSVSRRHAIFELSKRGLSVTDLGSQNGTSVNGEPAVEQVYLKPGDIIRVGYVAIFYFGFVSPDDPPQIEVVNQSIALVPRVPDAAK
jgi:hypothetical protein